jgi:uncharacterized membrane protein YphA (DoxX/SURF4 family)
MSGSPTTCRSAVPQVSRPLVGRLLSVLDLLCRWGLAAAFLAAGVSKVTNLAGFEDQVVLHFPSHPALARFVAAGLPWLELTCGFCLALGTALRETASITGLLLIAFIMHAWLNRTGTSCGCFFLPRSWSYDLWWQQTLRDLVLLLCSVRIARAGNRSVRTSLPLA